MNLKDYTNMVLRDSDFKPYDIENGTNTGILHYHTLILPISNLGDLKMIFVKQKREQEVSCFLVSNDIRLPSEEIIDVYSAQWCIETHIPLILSVQREDLRSLNNIPFNKDKDQKENEFL